MDSTNIQNKSIIMGITSVGPPKKARRRKNLFLECKSCGGEAELTGLVGLDGMGSTIENWAECPKCGRIELKDGVIFKERIGKLKKLLRRR